MGHFRRGIFGLFVVISSLAHAETEVTVTDTHGNDVQVSLREINRAYFETFEPLGENHQITNGDGSISIVNPVFPYAGKKIPFLAYHILGVCKFFGFLSDHGAEYFERRDRMVMADMADDGTLKRIIHNVDGGSNRLVQVVVCSNRPQR